MQDRKIALITGGNRGIGLETARQLAQQGVLPVIAARRIEQGREAAARLVAEGLHADAIALDVTDSASIHAAAAELGQRYDRLDILINNAGIVSDTTGMASEQALPVWRTVFDVNVFGLIEVTQVLLPLLRRSAAGRIVNVSSVLGSLTEHSDPDSSIYAMKNIPAYNVSKTAVNAFTVQLAYELRDTPIKVNAIHPGYVKTEMNRGGGVMEIPDGARSSVAAALIPVHGPTGTFTHLGETIAW